MSNSKAATAAVLAGAVALASAAYGIGTQTGDGTAEAARDGQAPAERGLFMRFDGLADALGVDADELEDAMRDFHEQNEGELRDAFATALAEALGKPVDEVRAALDEVRPGGEGRRPGCAPHVSLRRLAAQLDVTRAELRKALRETRAGVDAPFRDRHEDLVRFLADRFGLSEEKVEEALPEPPRFAPGGPRFHHDARPDFGRGGPDFGRGGPDFGRGGPPPIGPGLLPG